MAPSSRSKSNTKITVAPSSIAGSAGTKTSTSTNLRGTKSLRPSTLKASLGRVTKSRLHAHTHAPKTKESQLIEVKLNAIEDLLDHQHNGEEQKQKVEVGPVPQELQKPESGTKRKRRQSCSSDEENVQKHHDLNPSRKRKLLTRDLLRIQLPSPPASRKGSSDCGENDEEDDAVSPKTIVSGSRPVGNLPQSLLDFIAIHSAFLKAISIHFAHNGTSAPAEMNTILESTTRLWKKQTVRRQDLQRMLGLYEVATDESCFQAKQVEQKSSPFKMVTSGLGSNVITNLEYIGQNPYNENSLQISYTKMVRKVFSSNELTGSATLPLLTIALGTQTSLRRAKVADTRAEILNLSAAAQARSTPDFSKLSISDPSEQAPASVKSRTLSLFDRVRAKALANAGNTTPTSEQILRRHAIGRIGEVVEFLRMKQQQKLSTQLYGSAHDSLENTRGGGKVSFSLQAIVRDIRQSVGVPIGEEEVKVCLQLLSQEVPGNWCRMIEIGSVTSVTLQGNGMSGIDVKRRLENSRQKV